MGSEGVEHGRATRTGLQGEPLDQPTRGATHVQDHATLLEFTRPGIAGGRTADRPPPRASYRCCRGGTTHERGLEELYLYLVLLFFQPPEVRGAERPGCDQSYPLPGLCAPLW